MFHYVMEKGLVYLCMTDEEFPRRVAFTFLEDIKVWPCLQLEVVYLHTREH